MSYKNHPWRRPIEKCDYYLICFFRKYAIPVARFALFVVFFWFGILKIIGTSPANPLVANLLEQTLPFISFGQFIFFFSLYEMLIGLTFLAKGYERHAMALLIPHMIMTSLPLFFLPTVAWQGFLTPTLEGQYIIKNLCIIALGFALASHLHPLDHHKR